MTIFNYLLSILFALAGLMKLFFAKPLKEQFEEFGLSTKMMLEIGALEVLGAIGLQLKYWSIYAAIGLLILMLGAVNKHLKAINLQFFGKP